MGFKNDSVKLLSPILVVALSSVFDSCRSMEHIKRPCKCLESSPSSVQAHTNFAHVFATGDPESDVWYHSRSVLIQAVSQSNLDTFMKEFNNITQQAFIAQSKETSAVAQTHCKGSETEAPCFTRGYYNSIHRRRKT
eukprot:6484112-Amphidinium_carterae.2